MKVSVIGGGPGGLYFALLAEKAWPRWGGNGFCGCSRVALLNILQDRGRELGVELRFGREVDSLDELPDSELIVVADGINSKIRESPQAHFQPSVDLRPNTFAWLGSTRPLEAFENLFRKKPAGGHRLHRQP